MSKAVKQLVDPNVLIAKGAVGWLTSIVTMDRIIMPHPVSITSGSVPPELGTFIRSDQTNCTNVWVAAAPAVRLGDRSVLRVTIPQGITVTTTVNAFGDVADRSGQASDDGTDVLTVRPQRFEAILYLRYSGFAQIVEAYERTACTLVHGCRLREYGQKEVDVGGKRRWYGHGTHFESCQRERQNSIDEWSGTRPRKGQK